ncbi:MAG: hypothetical protein R2710_15090 [Acidimicrobiales bacterium]
MQFEARGFAAAIVTQPFVATCAAMAEVNGFPDYLFAVVPSGHQSHERPGLGAGGRHYHRPGGGALLAPRVDVGDAATEGLDLAALVEELAEGLRTDGADLVADATGPSSVVLRLHIPTQACAECIMPADWLLPMFEQRIRLHSVTIDGRASTTCAGTGLSAIGARPGAPGVPFSYGGVTMGTGGCPRRISAWMSSSVIGRWM